MRLLIACGNRLRQDDGAGLVLAQKLATAWQSNGVSCRYLEVQQLVPELAVEIARDDVTEVWFVDSRVAKDAADTAVELRQLGSLEQSPSFGHQLAPEIVLLYAWTLFDERPSASQPPAWQITVPGFQFGHSETLSDACQFCLAEALPQLLHLNGEITYA